MNLKQDFKLNIKNILGSRTDRKIVVFSVDDYGNVRLDSKKARDNMYEQGLKPFSGFDYYDSLENEEDLLSLYETLDSVKDKNNNPAVFTAFAISANIDFEKMKDTGYTEYYYESLPVTFSKLKGYENVWKLWKEGIDKKLLVPEFHGREHFNLKFFNESLNKKNSEVLISLQNRSFSCISRTGYPTISYTAELDFVEFKENDYLKLILEDGLNVFEKVFGFRAVHFNACGSQGYNRTVEHVLAKGGIKFIDSNRVKNEHQGSGKYKKIFHYTGKKNKLGQTYLVRNCVFEPTEERGIDWVSFCLKQIEIAFKWKQPANISSHRLNFCGHIDPANRKTGLTSLKKLLVEIVKKWPDVEFMTSRELAGILTKQKDFN